ncbi:MAG: NTP transferase domain-containing protein [Candidatus Brocadiaceae bacterium]|nr:NTP transferase domain-containing protein [Candidatus Brocadiaceae bacterium]
MQVVILAGGKGTRLRPLTSQIPKPMVAVQGKPFLHHQLELIKSFGFKKVLLLVSYLGEQIESYFGDGSKFGLKIEYSYEETPLGTGGALKNAENRLLDEFLLLNGDTLLPIDYGDLINHFNKFDKIGTVTAYNNTEKIVPNNIAVGISNMVVGYNKKDPKGMTHVDAGGMVFKKDLLNMIPEGRICSLEEKILSVLINKKELAAFVSGQRFYDIGSFKDLELVQRVLR